MKRINLLIAVLGFSFIPFDSSLYQLQCTGLNQQPVNLSSFKGKKILINVFDAGKPDRQQLLLLDSLQRQNNATLAVIAVPVSDFSGALPEKNLKSLLFDTLKLSFTILEIGKAQKKQGINQYPLLKWLTNVLQNRHFNDDIEAAGRSYAINESGVLYVTISSNVLFNKSFMKEIISRQVSLTE